MKKFFQQLWEDYLQKREDKRLSRQANIESSKYEIARLKFEGKNYETSRE